MDTSEAIRTRRAVKHYDPDFVIPDKDEKELMDLVRQSPTSFNLQNWRFVNVKDKELRAQLRAIAWDQAQVTDSALLFVITGDLLAWDKDPARYMVNYPADISETYVPLIKDFYRGREWQQRDEIMRSAGIAAQTIMLAATSMGYDSCPMIGFDSDAVGKLINLPEDHAVCMMLAIGKGTAPARPKGGYLPDEEVFIKDRF